MFTSDFYFTLGLVFSLLSVAGLSFFIGTLASARGRTERQVDRLENALYDLENINDELWRQLEELAPYAPARPATSSVTNINSKRKEVMMS